MSDVKLIGRARETSGGHDLQESARQLDIHSSISLI
jgi:hypothetical protein